MINFFPRGTAVRARNIFLLVFTFLLPSLASSQVTHGQKPKLPPPFATNSAGNGPGSAKPPAGFLPTVPAGFRVKIFAASFKPPRLLTVAPSGDIFLADTGAGEIIVMRDPRHTGRGRPRGGFFSGPRRPLRNAFPAEAPF